jgi:plasmid stabilization system protein ParE
MSRYHITRRADRDLELIWQQIAHDNGAAVADRIERELHDAMTRLADHPRAGHTRADVSNPRYRFWSVHSFVIANRPDTRPLTVSRVVHGGRNFRNLFG